MIGVLVVTHGKMAEGIGDSVQLIMGEQEQFDTLGLHEGNDLQLFKDELYNKFVALDTGDGVLVLLDLFGGSPYNATAMNIARITENNHKIRLITGVNLPMILETLVQRFSENDIEKVYSVAVNSGKDGIKELMTEFGR